jgi:hypothetical protein
MTGQSERPSRPPRENRKAKKSWTGVGDGAAAQYAQVSHAFDIKLNAALARLRLHYAVRLAGLRLTARRDAGAAIDALLQEQESALASMREAILLERRQALRAIRRQHRPHRFRARLETFHIEPTRPRRTDPARSFRRSLNMPYSKP